MSLFPFSALTLLVALKMERNSKIMCLDYPTKMAVEPGLAGTRMSGCKDDPEWRPTVTDYRTASNPLCLPKIINLKACAPEI